MCVNDMPDHTGKEAAAKTRETPGRRKWPQRGEQGECEDSESRSMASTHNMTLGLRLRFATARICPARVRNLHEDNGAHGTHALGGGQIKPNPHPLQFTP